MTTITFDTQEAVIKLKQVGVSQEQADAFARVIVESHYELATKHDLTDLENRLVIKMGALIAVAIGIVAVLVKLL